jgi:hypothetical protein
MAFRKVKGKTKNIFLPVTPSTVIAAGALVAFDTGLLVAATATSTKLEIIGVLVGAIAATDADYADTRKVAVQIPTQTGTLWEFDTTGLVAADIGKDVDLTSSVLVNRAAVTIGIVKVLKRMTATLGQGNISFKGGF